MKPATVLAGIGVFVVLGAVTGGLIYIRHNQDKKSEQNRQAAAVEPASTVETVAARTIQYQPTADLVGTVLALRSVTIANELAGNIRKIEFVSGSIVEAGAVLLTQDDDTDRADLAAAESSVRVAEANVAVADARLKLANTEFHRISEAVKLRAMSDVDQDRAEAERDRAAADRDRLLAEIDQAKAKVAQVKTRLAKRVIRAPFRGRCGLRNIHEGQYLAEGASVVMFQEVSDTINIDFAIPQEYLPRVAPGTTVMATGALLGPDPVQIKVVAVDAAVNFDTRNVRIRSVVDNSGDRLRPGMFLQIRVPVEAPSPRTVVPSTAVRRAPYGDQVYKIVPAEQGTFRAKQAFVTLGETLGSDVIVVSGLEPGEEIAAAGSFKLRDQALVLKAAPKPAPTDKAPGKPGDEKPAAK
jgi:membrane fusion protein (multidrug efflux system)